MSALVRPVTEDEVDTFWRDGVVCLRGVLDPAVVEGMSTPVDALLGEPEVADLSAMGDGLARAGESILRDEASSTAGKFLSGVDHWRGHEAFRAFACDSALPAVAGAVLRASTVYLWEDSVLVKEPGARERTAWHQDLGYFQVHGEQLCTTWVPLDPVTAETGAVRFARGSHRWDHEYRPNLFVTSAPIPGTQGDEVPDVEALAVAGDVEILTFELGPGDLTVHHARTLHAAGANRSTTTRRRAISVRYCGDDARYRAKAGMMAKPHHSELHDGDPLGGEGSPAVWRAGD